MPGWGQGVQSECLLCDSGWDGGLAWPHGEQRDQAWSLGASKAQPAGVKVCLWPHRANTSTAGPAKPQDTAHPPMSPKTPGLPCCLAALAGVCRSLGTEI